MKRTIQTMLPVIAILFPFLLACPGGGDRGLITAPPPPDGNTLAFQWNGPAQIAAGSYGSPWDVLTSPQVFSGSRVYLNGPGVLLDLLRTAPLDLSRSDLSPQGWYVPPATVPTGGTTINLSIDALSPFTHKWEHSQNFPIQVVQQTTPMVFRLGTNYDGTSSPSAITLHPGQTSDSVSGKLAAWWIDIQPWPLNLPPQFQLTSNQPQSTDIGSVNLIRSLDSQTWTFNFTAPSVIANPFDVTVRATLHDPWFNLDPHVDFTVHLVPN